MSIFNFFRRKTNPGKKTEEKASIEQMEFAEEVLKVIAPTIEKFNFVLYSTQIKKYSTKIIWRKENQYVKVTSTNYPTDYPYYYNIVLGEGNSDNFFESDWNSVAVWALVRVIEPTANINSYDFPFGEKVIESISDANKHLLKYGRSFLSSDLTIFNQARKLINEKREPYKIHAPDENGIYIETVEPKSAEQKEKYS
jgi:hypothetical protein